MWNSNHWYYQRVSKYKYAIAIQSMQSFFHFIVLEVHWQLGLLVSSSAVTSYHTYKGDKADMSKKLSDKDVFKVPIEFSQSYHLMALNFRYNTGCPKINALSECSWSHTALAQTPFAGIPCVWRLNFWSFLIKTKQDQVPPSHFNGKI